MTQHTPPTFDIELDTVAKDYAGEQALKGVSFTVEKGALFGIIGPDGAGKTTLMRILATLINADAGRARVLSHDTTRELRDIRRRIGYMPQRFSLYEDLSVRENMLFFADVFGVTGSQRAESIERLMAFSRLDPFQNRRAGALSGGMKQKLALSCALIHTPELLILDEPTTGVDPVSRMQFWEILGKLQRDGITLLISTPYMDEAEYCSELVLLHRGTVLDRGSPAGLKQRYPLDLYKISAPDANLHFPQSQRPPDPISLLYPAKGSLHAAVPPKSASADQLLVHIRGTVPRARDCRPIEPRVEDVFFHALARGNEA